MQAYTSFCLPNFFLYFTSYSFPLISKYYIILKLVECLHELCKRFFKIIYLKEKMKGKGNTNDQTRFYSLHMILQAKASPSLSHSQFNFEDFIFPNLPYIGYTCQTSSQNFLLSKPSSLLILSHIHKYPLV